MIQHQQLQQKVNPAHKKDGSDFGYLYHNDIDGLLKKHGRYISHYAKSMAKNFEDFEDIKQDLLCETLDLINWVNKDKINKNFELKYFIFQKCNAYRKSKKNRQHYIYHEDFENINNNNFSSIDVEKEYCLKHDFPENCLDNELDKNIYFAFYIYGFKKKAICKDLNLSYGKLQERIYVIESKYSKY